MIFFWTENRINWNKEYLQEKRVEKTFSYTDIKLNIELIFPSCVRSYKNKTKI